MIIICTEPPGASVWPPGPRLPAPAPAASLIGCCAFCGGPQPGVLRAAPRRLGRWNRGIHRRWRDITTMLPMTAAVTAADGPAQPE